MNEYQSIYLNPLNFI